MNRIAKGFRGADGGWNFVELDGEIVFESRERRDCDMFAAELKGRLGAASREKELLDKLQIAEKALEEIAEHPSEDWVKGDALEALKAIRE